jgi:hypothetical protein
LPYPNLGNTNTYELEHAGVYDAIYSPSEETFLFLEDVLTEVITPISNKLIRGGDEAPKRMEIESSSYRSYGREQLKMLLNYRLFYSTY